MSKPTEYTRLRATQTSGGGLLPWPRFSLRAPTDELRGLPLLLRAKAKDADGLRAMQAELGCVWRSLFWTSLKGSCFGEGVRGDAFDALVEVLQRRPWHRLDAQGALASSHSEARPARSGSSAGSACSVAGGRHLPAHLATSRVHLAPGTTWRPAGAADSEQ